MFRMTMGKIWRLERDSPCFAGKEGKIDNTVPLGGGGLVRSSEQVLAAWRCEKRLLIVQLQVVPGREPEKKNMWCPLPVFFFFSFCYVCVSRPFSLGCLTSCQVGKALLANDNARGGSGPRRRKEAGSWRVGVVAPRCFCSSIVLFLTDRRLRYLQYTCLSHTNKPLLFFPTS